MLEMGGVERSEEAYTVQPAMKAKWGPCYVLESKAVFSLRKPSLTDHYSYVSATNWSATRVIPVANGFS